MKKTNLFSGVGTALVTPFSGGLVDYAALSDLIELQIEEGVDALIIGGTTGEAATLSDGERYALFEFARERIAGRVKMILGTGTNDTRVAKMHAKRAEEIGCDGLLLVTPYYNKGTEEGITRHYLSIAEEVSLPIILYNVPSRTGVNLGFGVLDRLSREENIVGIKEASDSADRLTELAKYGDELSLYAGNDSQVYSVLALGGKGVISVASNILPKTIRRIYESFVSGRSDESRAVQIALLPFIKALFAETNPSPIKAIMAERALLPTDEVRLPLAPPRDSTKDALKKTLKELSLLGYKD